jgi:hypothetical protein
MRWPKMLAFAILFLIIIGPAGAKDFVVSRNAGDYTLQVSINQNPPILGKNNVRVEIKDAAGKYVTDAGVTVNYFMPPMPGMPPMNYTAKALPRSSGYGMTMDLIMKGPWNIAIRAVVGGKQLRMTVLIDVR